MTVEFLMGSYKNSVCRPLSSPSSVNEKSDIVPSDDRPQIITTRGGNINSQAPVRNEPGRISFLEVPIASDLRRPSTADIVIKKLKVEKLEGGGLTISGFVLTGNCHIALIIFGLFFLLAGIVLTYVGFAVCNHHHHDAEPVNQALGSSTEKIHESDNHKQMQITGPIFMILGIIMLMIGMSLCGITSKVSKEANARRIAMSTAQLSQMEGNFFQSQSTAHNSPVHTTAPGPNQAYPILSLRRGSVWMEPTPIEFPQYKSESAVPSSEVATLDPARRSSSPMINNNIYYGDEASMDIATFPSEDYVSNSSPYPSGVVPSDPNRRESAKSEKKSQILEVVEANKCETQTISSSDKKTDSKPEIPRITVSNGSDVQSPSEFQGEFKDNFVTNMTMSIASNLPLAKNGISLPRLSRHSMSRAEIPQPTRSSSQSFEDR